jgi:pyruvate dehydrogenase E2 component (dihydrolipoamide acetyltransferase)
MAQLAKELADLAVKARDRKVTLDDLTGGTFTVSNQGGIGGAHFTPIVNKPEVAILGLGRGIVKPVVKNGKVEPATMLPVCVSYDHRVIDGGAAARFTKDLLAGLENFPEEALKM